MNTLPLDCLGQVLRFLTPIDCYNTMLVLRRRELYTASFWSWVLCHHQHLLPLLDLKNSPGLTLPRCLMLASRDISQINELLQPSQRLSFSCDSPNKHGLDVLQDYCYWYMTNHPFNQHSLTRTRISTIYLACQDSIYFMEGLTNRRHQYTGSIQNSLTLNELFATWCNYRFKNYILHC